MGIKSSKLKTVGNYTNEFGPSDDDPELLKTFKEISSATRAQFKEPGYISIPSLEESRRKIKKGKENEERERIEQREAAIAAQIAAVIAAKKAKENEWRRSNPPKNLKVPPVSIDNSDELEVVYNNSEFAGGFKRRKTRKSKKRIVRPLKKTLSLSRSAR